MRKRRTFLAALAIAVLVVTPATGAAAATDGTVEPPTTSTRFMPMTIGGYNEDVAAANGYEIVTNEDGTQTSVPVTPEAIAAEKLATAKRSTLPGTARLGDVTPSGEAWGDCGGSWVQATKKAGDTVGYQTGFVVFGAATGYWWKIDAHGALTSNGALRHGTGPAVGNKSWEGNINGVVGPGFAIVPVWSNVQLVSGAICYSMGPTHWFG